MALCSSTGCSDLSLGLGAPEELVVPACRERGGLQSRHLSLSAAVFCCLSNTSAVVLHILNPPGQVKQPVPPAARECMQKPGCLPAAHVGRDSPAPSHSQKT